MTELLSPVTGKKPTLWCKRCIRMYVTGLVGFLLHRLTMTGLGHNDLYMYSSGDFLTSQSLTYTLESYCNLAIPF